MFVFRMFEALPISQRYLASLYRTHLCRSTRTLANMATSNSLKQIRALMKNKAFVENEIHAYIVPTDDAHQSEIPAECDLRRAFVSRFTGSAGTAIITADQAALWADGRYHIQAADQLDSNWTLMKDGLQTTPTQAEWLCKVLPPGGRVGVDPYVLSAAQWNTLHKNLEGDGFILVPVLQNLVDNVWSERPDPPTDPVIIQTMDFAGQQWEDKIKVLRGKMEEKKVTCLVITALDDVAWLFNLRGNDIPHVPVFFSYALLTMDAALLFVDSNKLSPAIYQHLGVDENQKPKPDATVKVQIFPYGDIKTELSSIVENSSGKIWISNSSSYALHSVIPEKRRFIEHHPIPQLRTVKNAVEISGMQNAHIKDAAALCEYFAWLEKEVPKAYLTEISAADYLETLRSQQEDYVSISFDTISSVGSNGAIIHYKPMPETDKLITTDEVYLCDSGGQYKDGTTDVTRTLHFGTPSRHVKECFTRVLKGHIALSSVIFPNNVKGHMLDTLARVSLWKVGLNYLHGTGHGVGSFLTVHEGPVGVSFRVRDDEMPLKEGCIVSNEPGYYEDGQFGIRIESLVLVKKADTKYNFKDVGFLTFEPITWVPIQTKMILPELLTEDEIAWLNDYHQSCLDKVGPLLEKQGKKNALQWLQRETQALG